MAEYTNIDAFAEDIRSRFCNKCNNALLAINCGDCWVDKALLEIENAPTADVIEVRHGSWVSATPSGGYDFYCSYCKEFAITYEDSNYREQYYLTDYCPNCGAKMDGKDDV